MVDLHGVSPRAAQEHADVAGVLAVRDPRDHADTRPARSVLAGGVVAALLAALVGDEWLVQPALTVAALATSLALVAGVRLYRPPSTLAWWLLALCIALVGVGEALLLQVGSTAVFGQFVTSIGSAAGFIGLFLLLRKRLEGQARSSTIDAAIFAAGIGAAIWAVGLAPLAVSSHQSTFAAAAFLYPALVALVVIARMWTVPGASQVSTRLLFLVAFATLAIIILDLGQGLVDRAWFTPPLILAEFLQLTFLATLGLHPSMAAPTEAMRAPTGRLSRAEVTGLFAALAMNPLSILVDVGLGREANVTRYVVGGVLLAGLVMARIVDAQTRLDRAMVRQDALTAQLAKQAMSDELTALPNRRAFDGLVKAAFEERSPTHPTAVILLDLDDFKDVNDTYGHEVGDGVLVAVGNRLRAAMRGGDIAARLGGDEFVVILRDCPSSDAALAAARRIQAAIAVPLQVGAVTHQIRTSAGVAMATENDRLVEDLIRHADIAMYRAKARDDGSVILYVADGPALDRSTPMPFTPARPIVGI